MALMTCVNPDMYQVWPPFVRYPGISETAKTDLRAYAAAGNNVLPVPLFAGRSPLCHVPAPHACMYACLRAGSENWAHCSGAKLTLWIAF